MSERVYIHMELARLAGPGRTTKVSFIPRLLKIPYFTYSLAKILSATKLDKSMTYDKGTWFIIEIKYSIFTWHFGKYSNAITDSKTFIPELETQAFFSKFFGFYKSVISIIKDSAINFTFASIGTKYKLRTGKPMNFTPEV